jgi:hypothetical protein
MSKGTFGSLVVLGLAAVAGCGSDEGGGDDDPAPADATVPDAVAVDAMGAPDGAPAARIAATVEYSGIAVGTLILAGFTSFPPQGPPVSFAQDSTPSFPASLELTDLEPQTLYVLALLDVAPASPTQPGPEDLSAWSEALVVEEGETTSVTLTLLDP